MKNKPLTISNLSIQAGERIALALPTPEIYSCAKAHIPIHVLHGKKEGPVLVVCATMHGDEMNGIAIIQKLLNLQFFKSMSGTLIAIPVLNINGLLTHNRSLLDRRDLESAFPGSETGSFASRLAKLLTEEIFSLATHCIDLHSSAPRTVKYPQIHTNRKFEEAGRMVKAFQAPLCVHTDSKRGLLWLMQQEKPIPTILYDTGEPARLDFEGIRIGVKGIVRVMRELGMLPPTKGSSVEEKCRVIDSVPWVRSSSSGLCRFYKLLGHFVKKGDLLARISDPFGTKNIEEIHSAYDGIVIAQSTFPIVNEGDPILEIGETALATEKKEAL